MKSAILLLALSLGASAEPVTLPDGYTLETTLAVFPALPKHAMNVKVTPAEILVTIEAIGRFPDNISDNSAFSNFVQEFGYPKSQADQLNRLELTMERDACVYDPVHPEAIACVYFTGHDKIKTVTATGHNVRVDLTPHINGFFEGGVASRVTHGFDIPSEEQPRFHFSIRLSATGKDVNGGSVYAVLELKNQSAHFVKVTP